MKHGTLAWAATLALVVGLLLFDYFFHVRKAHVPTLKEAARWSAVYVGIAVAFGLAIFLVGGSGPGTEYFAGYLTEKALSVDNVFVFLIIMASFKVPRQDQQKALLMGITIALVARAGLIFLGGVLIERFGWVFYVFGIGLLFTAGHMLRPEDKRHDPNEEGLILRLTRRLIPTSDSYDGDKLFVHTGGRRRMTPMVLVIVTLGLTDVMFALDSIPAIFGLTQDVFIVFTATAFSLLGLRQLFFLVERMLERLVYLPYGLAAILGLIGLKLILHALRQNNVPFINDGAPVHVLEISTAQSLLAIGAILTLTVLASLLSPKGKAKAAVGRLRQALAAYRDLDERASAAQREAAYARVRRTEDEVRKLPAQFRALIQEPQTLREMLADAHARHGAGSAFLRNPARSGRPRRR